MPVEYLIEHIDNALPLYEAECHKLGKANVLQSLGDLELQLGNIDTARGHLENALPLYEAQCSEPGKASTLMSLGDLEFRLGNIGTAREHKENALPLYEATLTSVVVSIDTGLIIPAK